MCLAVTGEIIELLDANARVSIMGVETIVNIQLIENIQKGEFVLVHAGCAIEKVSIAYAKELEEQYKLLLEGEGYD